MPGGVRRRSKQQPKKPKEAAQPKWYCIRDILRERKRGGRIEYLVDWESDQETGEQYSPTWASSKDVTSKAIFDWRQKQDQEIHATHIEEVESQYGHQAGSQNGGASRGSPRPSALDSSQSVQDFCKRKRAQRARIVESPAASQFEDSEDESEPPKRQCSEAVSSLSSGSEAYTDAASDILANVSSAFFVVLPSKLERDVSEYISISDSQGSTTFGSQSVSNLEDTDSQVLLAEGLSQRTIPDSQEYSTFDFDDSPLAVVQAGLVTTNREEHSSGLEISDSQKQSSLGTYWSKVSDSQAHQSSSSGHHSQLVVPQSSLRQALSGSSQGYQEDPELLECVPLTQDAEGQGPFIPSTFPPFLERQLWSAEPSRPRSASEDSAVLAAQAAAQLAEEQDLVPVSTSDTSIPSHQADNLQTGGSTEHSLNRHASQSTETPVFLTQPAFEFDVASSQAPTSQDELVSSSSGRENFQTAHRSTEPEEPTISDSQASVNSQHAQIVPPLPNISASRLNNSSNTEEDFVPDTVRRRPQKRRLSIDSSGSAASSRDGVQTNLSTRLLIELRCDRQPREESFQTGAERRIPSPTANSSTPNSANRRPVLAAAMETSNSGEQLSAVEELLRIQEAALQGSSQSTSNSPTGDLGQVDDNGDLMGGPTADLAFAVNMDNPTLTINSQPPMSTDWQMGAAMTSSTDMPVLTSAPGDPMIQAPVDEAPQTASMGDIFPSNLMPPESAEPMTISPSDISRSIEPDEGLAALHQHEVQRLDIMPAEDTATAKSTTSSPDVEEQYQSGPPTAMDQKEYLVTLAFPANTRPLYLNTMTSHKREIEKFNQNFQKDGTVPDQTMVDAIDQLFGKLREICDAPAALDSSAIEALSATDMKKHAMGTNSKYFFVGQFLERLQTSNKRILIVVRDINIIGYLEAVVGIGDMAYSLKGLHELESQDEHSLHIVLLHTEQPLVDDLSDFDVVIGFDCGILQTDLLMRWAQMHGKRPMLIRLMITNSIEHLNLMLPPDLTGLDRKNALLITMFQARSLVANDEQGEMIDGLASAFASQVIDPEPNFGWEPELVPPSVLEIYSSTQNPSQVPPSAEELTSRKRKADDSSQNVTKRLRLSPSPGRKGGIDKAVRGHLNPNPSCLQVRTTQKHLDSLTTKISKLEHELAEKKVLEFNMREHIISLSKRIKSHDMTIDKIQERHMAALRDRSVFETQRDEAKTKEEAACEQSRFWQEKSKALEEEIKQKSASFEKALVDAGTVATDVFKQKTDELDVAMTKIAELEKKLTSRESELDYARDAYQTANQTNSELSRENKELKEQAADYLQQAASSIAQVQHTNALEQIKEMKRQATETQAIVKDRERELARVEKELRTLKNGRRETRQQSVPRSPRLGMMSPRAPRTAGGSASRGTSPTPHDSTGGTPVPGIQLFNAPANGRWGHLRD